MENIKKLTGYMVEGKGIYLSRGKAIDEGVSNDQLIDYFAVDIECCEGEDLAEQYYLRQIKVIDKDTGYIRYLSPWLSNGVYDKYLSEAWEYLKHGNLAIDHSSKRLDTEMYPEPEFPQTVTFQIDNKGRFFTHIQMEPNVYGKYTPGKVFFPDKSWMGTIFTGNAVCSIKSEKEKYGFLSGHMCPFPSPSREELLDYLWEKHIFRDDIIITCYKLDSVVCYGVISDWGSIKDSVVRVQQFVKEEVNNSIYLSQTYIDFNAREFNLAIQWQKQLGDLWLNDATNGKLTMAILEDAMKPSSYFVNQIIKGRWVRTSKSSNNELIDDIIENNIAILYNLEGYDIFCLSINHAMLGKLSSYFVTEIEQLIADVSVFNRCCDEQIAAKLKRGQIALKGAHII